MQPAVGEPVEHRARERERRIRAEVELRDSELREQPPDRRRREDDGREQHEPLVPRRSRTLPESGRDE
jgi:hypothetical protein